MTDKELIAQYKAENEAMKAKLAAQAKASKISFKVSEKGAISVYGLGRFPVTLYQEQWERLLAHNDDLKAFIEANRTLLKLKGDAPRAVEAKPEAQPATPATKPEAQPATPATVLRKAS